MKLNGAILGFGEVAEKAHAPAFLKRKKFFEIKAVFDASKRRLEKARSLFPSAALYASADEFFAGERGLNFADIALPPSLHYPFAAKALGLGLNVLCEKPLALKAEHIEKIQRAASEKNLAVFTVHNWKYAPQTMKMIGLARKGILGKINYADFCTLRKKPSSSALKGWRKNPEISGGGILVDHGWHIFYLLPALVGEIPVSISAGLKFSRAGSPVEEEASCLVRFKNATGAAHMSWKSPARKNLAMIYGSKGWLEMLDDEILLETAKGRKRFKFKKPLSAGSAHPEWMVPCLDDFLKAVKNPRRGNTGEARRCLKMIEGSFFSHKHGSRRILL